MTTKYISSITLSLFFAVTRPLAVFSAQGTGYVEVRVFEEGSENLVPCRSWVEINNARYYKPVSKNCIPYEKDMSFSSNGMFKIEVPAGNALVHVERGKEYFPVNKEVLVTDGKVAEVQIFLQRWINMAELGWYSMDMHCHFGADSLEVLKQQSLADDVNFQPVLTVWNARRYQTCDYWQENSEDPVLAVDSTHLISFNNQEIERIGGQPFHSVGAPHFLGLNQPLDNPPSRTWPADAMLCASARTNSPGCIIDCDKPVWGENVVTAALGLFSSAQICHNHYHRFSDLDMCCGMAELKTSAEEDQNWARLFWQTNHVYYMFLNCGIKLAASGGSAMGVMRLPLGYNRTYIKIEAPFTEKNVLKALAAGRTFATSGPIIFFSVNGKECGETIRIKGGKDFGLSVSARLKSIEPIESFEIIHDGKILKKLDLRGKIPGPVLEEQIDFEFKPGQSGWLAARAVYFNQNRFVRQAHTSPVYIVVENQPLRSSDDARQLIGWIDQLMNIQKNENRYRTEKEREEVLAIYMKAKKFYEDQIDRTLQR